MLDREESESESELLDELEDDLEPEELLEDLELELLLPLLLDDRELIKIVFKFFSIESFSIFSELVVYMYQGKFTLFSKVSRSSKLILLY